MEEEGRLKDFELVWEMEVWRPSLYGILVTAVYGIM